MRLFVDPMNPRRATDVLETRRLMMAREAGVKRAVYVSIVGMEGAAFPITEANSLLKRWCLLRCDYMGA